MVEKLRWKFIIISVISVSIVLIIISSFINISNYEQISKHADELLDILSNNEGFFPKIPDDNNHDRIPNKKMSAETPFSTRFFTVKINEKSSVVAIDTGKIASINTKDAYDYAMKALEINNETGFIDNYKYRISYKNYGSLIVFVDCSRDLQVFNLFLKNSIIICLVGISAVFILVMLFSKKAIAPVAISYEKQKQFITDASHELKTPISVISANTDVIEMDYGESEWTVSTHNQISRLSELINNLISLSRMDEEENKLQKIEFSLSDAILESAKPYVALARNVNKIMSINVQDNIVYYGDEKSIKNLVTILLDNAIKYASENSTINLFLKTKGKKCIIETSNCADNLKIGSYDILFERFYRGDVSRNSKKSGYGIGLSLANSIVAKHKGSITALSPDGKYIKFIIVL